LLLQPLDALDERLEVILGETMCGGFVLDGGCGGHRALLERMDEDLASGVGARASQVKAHARSSTQCTVLRVAECCCLTVQRRCESRSPLPWHPSVLVALLE